jgi:hypothetical protein
LVSWGKNRRLNLVILSFLATTKIINKDLYNSIKVNKSNWDDIDRFFNFPKEEKPDRNSRALSYIRDWIKYCVFTDAEYNALDEEDQVRQLTTGNAFHREERDQIIPMFCRYMDFTKIPE